ncbi:MAG: HAMP domain-containing protein [Limnobacter sp.]|nr:HAMP domain-containing protein [Limnobacter sp.]
MLDRLDRLHLKLFAAIAGANVLLAVVAFVVIGQAFDRGFVEYLNRTDEARLTPLIGQLAEHYEREGDWSEFTGERRRWFDLTREVLGWVRPGAAADHDPARQPGAALEQDGRADQQAPPASSQPPAAANRARADPLLTIDPRLMLFDAERSLLVGREEMAGEAILRPIDVGGSTVGYLGYVPRLQMVESLERLFSAQQQRRYAAIGAGMVVAGLLVGALLAWSLTRRIRQLGAGAAALIRGDYGARVQVDGHDELAELAADFNRLGDSLEAARRARQQWIADIAHELRTPLASLRAEIEALQDGIRPLDPESLASLAQEVGQLTRLVEDLRLLSMSDLGALDYRLEPLDLGELIGDTLQARRALLAERGLALEAELPPAAIVSGDDARLTQVFANLLQNTLRYTDAPGRLRVALAAQGERVVVTWEDSAPGVAADDLPRLSDRLFRVDGSRSRAGGGSGLGLAIADAIVTAHEGSMRASASPLGGLRWTIELPRLAGGSNG